MFLTECDIGNGFNNTGGSEVKCDVADLLSYGYRVVRVLESQPRGEREIHPGEAAIVQRIFRAFVAGLSPQAIGKILNAEGIPGADGRRVEPVLFHFSAEATDYAARS